MTKKRKTNEDLNFDKDILFTNSDMFIGFIGVSLIWLGALSVVTEVPKEFTIGASLSGFFFSFADLTVTSNKITKLKVIIYMLCLMSAAISFVFVPAFLLVEKDLGNILVPYTDAITVLALGIVITSFGNRIRLSRDKQREEIRKELQAIRELLNNTSNN